MRYNLNIGSIYNFSMLAPSVLGVSYNNATLVGILDFGSAMLVQDVTTLHSNVYGALPPGTPKEAKDLIYLKIKTTTGEYRVISFDWLANEPVLVENKTVKITLNNVDISRLNVLRTALLKNGFDNFTIDTV